MQRQAVYKVNGPVLVLAGAGSGKTTVLVNRIAYLLQFGNAWESEKLYRDADRSDVDCLKRLISGDESVYEEISDILSDDAPKPWQVLAITFTNKAASELKSRIEDRLGPVGQEIWASTFHSACSKILRRYADRLGFSNHFTIYDTDDSRRAMKECMKELNVDEKAVTHKGALAEISRAKDNLIGPELFRNNVAADFRLAKIADLYDRYQKKLRDADAMDFDDMIFYTVKLLSEHSDVRDHYQNRFRYVMVDEYQDTNHAQYILVSLLAGKYNNLCVVGDDDQSIYKFRGATIENILKFEDRYSGAVTIRLEQNYRSTQTILDAANAVISHNSQRKGKNLWTGNGEGEKIECHVSDDEQEEARFVSNTVLDGVSQGKKFKDFAVLYRTNAQSNTVENAFVRMGIPYDVFGGHKFYDRKEIKDAMSYLTVINNPSDEIRLRRIINEPKRGIGETTIEKASDIAQGLGISLFEVICSADEYPALKRSANALMSFGNTMKSLMKKSSELSLRDLLVYCLDITGYLAYIKTDPLKGEERLENLDELANNLQRFSEENEEADLTLFLEETSLLTDIDTLDEAKDCVSLMTLHSAKGLEFDTVFIIGMENGLFPGRAIMYEPSEIEEERRLAYVGITRAKKKLYLTRAETRLLYGSTSYNTQSVFTDDIPENLIKQTGSRVLPSSQYRFPRMDKEKPQLKSEVYSPVKPKTSIETFKPGDRVLHKTFGEGLVLSVKALGNDNIIEIAFDKVGTKKVMSKFANMKKI